MIKCSSIVVYFDILKVLPYIFQCTKGLPMRSIRLAVDFSVNRQCQQKQRKTKCYKPFYLDFLFETK